MTFTEEILNVKLHFLHLRVHWRTIQANGKNFTNLHKFLARAAVSFLFRSSFPLFRHDPSIFEFSIKSIPAKLHICGILIVTVDFSSRQFLCLFHDVVIVLLTIRTCMNYHNVRFFTCGKSGSPLMAQYEFEFYVNQYETHHVHIFLNVCSFFIISKSVISSSTNNPFMYNNM